MRTFFRSAFAVCVLQAAIASLLAFEVIKDVNSPSDVQRVLFEKGKGIGNLVMIDEEHCKFSLTDEGSLQCHITGNAEGNPRIAWKDDGMPGSFDLLKYDYLIVTLRVEGNHKTTRGNKVSEQRSPNMWVPIVMYDAEGNVLGSANMADPTPNGETPATTMELIFPKSLLTFWGPGKGQVSAIGFKWNKAGPETERDYRIVIDKIALANH